jgi:hypothetical protein
MGHVACTGEIVNTYNILALKLELRKHTKISRIKWHVDIKMDHAKLKQESTVWSKLAQDRFQRQVVNLRVPRTLGSSGSAD